MSDDPEEPSGSDPAESAATSYYTSHRDLAILEADRLVDLLERTLKARSA